jgi:hypothetical protein
MSEKRKYISNHFLSLTYDVYHSRKPELLVADTHHFSHGQLYVACSRVGKPSNLFVYIPEGKTKNIVYSKALQ